MKSLIPATLFCFITIALPAQSGVFKAPDSCAQANNPDQCRTCGDYYYWRSKYAQALPFYEKANQLMPSHSLLFTIYDLHKALHIPFDTTRFYKGSSSADLMDYARVLNRQDDWIMAATLCKKAIAMNPEVEAKLLLYDISLAGKLPFDMRTLTELKSTHDLIIAGNHFLENSDYGLAKSLFERSEKRKHSPYAIIGLHSVSLLTKSDFDMQLFFNARDAEDLQAYALYFSNLANQQEQNRDKIPDARNSVLLEKR